MLCLGPLQRVQAAFTRTIQRRKANGWIAVIDTTDPLRAPKSFVCHCSGFPNGKLSVEDLDGEQTWNEVIKFVNGSCARSMLPNFHVYMNHLGSVKMQL